MASVRKGRLDVGLGRNPLLNRESLEGSDGPDYRAFLHKNRLWLLAIGSLLVVLVILISLIVDSRQRVMAMEEQRRLSLANQATAAAKVPVSTPNPGVTPAVTGQATPVPTSNPGAAEEHPVASNQFPGTVSGPAIVQWWDGGSACGIFRLSEGETFTYEGQGTWWQFPSEAGMEGRYPTHRTEYFNSNQGCHEGKPME